MTTLKSLITGLSVTLTIDLITHGMSIDNHTIHRGKITVTTHDNQSSNIKSIDKVNGHTQNKNHKIKGMSRQDHMTIHELTIQDQNRHKIGSKTTIIEIKHHLISHKTQDSRLMNLVHKIIKTIKAKMITIEDQNMTQVCLSNLITEDLNMIVIKETQD